MTTHYVLGFLFNSGSPRRVVLIIKQKPKWQAGFSNGIGGKVEEGETPAAAMTRESNEEIGVSPLWKYYHRLDVPARAVIHCFFAENSVAFDKARTMETEEIIKVRVGELQDYNCLSNLHWLIPMALDKGVLDSTTVYTID